jgi:hypothetical protein
MFECKSLNHTYSVGDQVFDLPSQQLATITKIELRKFDSPGSIFNHGVEERPSFNPTTDNIVSPNENFFLVTIDPAPAVAGYDEGRIVTEFCLPEEADRFRGQTEM